MKATVSSRSSISPCRQLCPSIFEIEAMFPAPKAAAGDAKRTSPTRHTRRKVDVRVILKYWKGLSLRRFQGQKAKGLFGCSQGKYERYEGAAPKMIVLQVTSMKRAAEGGSACG